jgi:hypothetical protein
MELETVFRGQEFEVAHLVPVSRRFSSVDKDRWARIGGQGGLSTVLYKTSALIKMSETKGVLVTGKSNITLGRMVGIHGTPVIGTISR